MDKTIISSDMLDKLEASLQEHMSIIGISHSDNIVHVRTNSEDVITGWLAVSVEEASLEDKECDILLEYERGTKTHVGQLRFVNYGHWFVNDRLAEKFGGCVSDSVYWVLYDEKRDKCLPGAGMFGYKGDKLPTAKEIIQFIEELYEKK